MQSSRPPGVFGGNLDNKDLVAGTTLYLPVFHTGALFYTGSLFPWKGDLIAGGLSSQALIRLTLDGSSVKSENRIDMGRRIRDVIEAPDGALLAITDEKDGALSRLTPARSTEP